MPSVVDTATIGAFAKENAKVRPPGQGKRLSFRVVLNDALQPEERFVTLAHELGHIFCGHLGGCTAPGRQEDDESGWPDRRYLGGREKEIEAEAVAYVVSARAGVITRSPEYLKPYALEADLSSVNEDLIVRAAARIERLADLHYGRMSFKR